ncbi:hypothetical protein [Occultella gossypii]|uniref:Uncharacterized protein n=1 Tax=Occultella gossypii TaxID=2800820 RepID=A0ABS7S6B2_9MICO|nr:hypothetical protein [Occultella gossypii]MBZ2195885.1 hypothetical protein [Occultella gossypii]
MRHPKISTTGCAAAIALGLLTLLPTAASAEAGQAPTGGCLTADDGVTVVVDFTDVGGAVEVGCAEGDPASGREALELAGFTLAEDSAGLICAVNAQPDPCPTVFEGSFWSYWTAEPGAEWVSSTVGADLADPVVGSYEGWRYFDGSAGPTVTAADVAAGAEGAGETMDGSAEPAESTTDAETEQGSGAPVGVIAGLAGVVVVGLAAVLVARRRTAQRED